MGLRKPCGRHRLFGEQVMRVQFKERINAGETAIGTWAVIPSSESAEVLASGGLDFIIIDMEHGSMGFETAQNMVRGAMLHGCAALVRVPANIDWMILRALEIGSDGVVIPQIQSLADAERAVSACYYHPLGMRGASPFTRASNYLPDDPQKTFAQSNERTTTVLLVEGMSGINDIESIIELSGIDVLYVGTFDLSQAAGYPGQPNHPKVLDFTEHCVRKIAAKGIAPGILVQSPEEVSRARSWGIRFLAYRADVALLKERTAAVAQLVEATE